MDDTFFILLGLLGLFYLIGMPILVFVLFSRVTELRSRLENLPRSGLIGETQQEIAISDPAPQAQKETAEITPAPKGPWAAKKLKAAAVEDDHIEVDVAPKAPSYASRFLSWAVAHWVYLVSALSLALAGVFLVQYGAENGLLPPVARVAAALIFGLALIGAGEWIRRKYGDSEESVSAYLPSVFSGAGIVSLFGGVLAGRVLYDLITPSVAFGGFFVIALGALVLGWFYGPLLAAIGLIGGFVAPFILGGSSDTPEMLLLYFMLLAILGLGIDTIRRWAWVSVLSVGLAFGAGALLCLSDPQMTIWFSLYVTILTLSVVLIPAQSFRPDQGGRTLLYTLLGRRKKGQPFFPSLLAAGTLLAAVALIVVTTPSGLGQFWYSYALLSFLIVIFTIWSRTASGLADQPLLPTLGALSLLAIPDMNQSARHAFRADRLPEAPIPMDTVLILVTAAIVTLVFAWRSGQGRLFRPLWAIAAAVYLPAIGLLLEYQWAPASIIGSYHWALQSISVGALMVLLAERFARFDGKDRTRASFSTMSALAIVAFTFSILFTTAALTIALAAVVLCAAWLDRKFTLPLMEWFILAGVAGLSYRLVVDPGLDWAFRAPFVEILFAQGAAVAACVGGVWLLKDMSRRRATVTLDSGAWAFGGILVSTILYKLIAKFVPNADPITHWSAGLYATIWFGLAIAQLRRIESFRMLRLVLASVFGLLGAASLGVAVTFVNPLVSLETVVGPSVLNTLIPAYLLPSMVLLIGSWKLNRISIKLRNIFISIAGLGIAFWIALVIRDFWQSDGNISLELGFSQPELYTYTLALLVLGAALFYQSLAKNSDVLRRAGLAVIALSVAKVFLVDISGLTGLIRVFSLLALGLMLAGMAWLDRWARARHET